MELEQAKKIASTVLNAIKPYCSRGVVAGSIRREKPLVKDIEIVAICKDYRKLYETLGRYGKFIKPGTQEIIEWAPKPNAKYVRMLLNEGIKLDLFLANEDNWGGILVLRTGSGSDEEGNPYGGFSSGIFSKWKEVSGGGRSVNGQFMTPEGKVYPLREEKDVFEILGIEWVEPKNRTSRSAIKPRG